MIVCSGPCLTLQDCFTVAESKLTLCAVNCSWTLLPYNRLQYIFGMDMAFWKAYHNGIDSFAERWTCNKTAAALFKLKLWDKPRISGLDINSGIRAVQFAMAMGAKKIILLGLGGAGPTLHWHSDHNPAQDLTNPDQLKFDRWEKAWTALKQIIPPDVTIINASEYSTNTHFTKKPLIEALHGCYSNNRPQANAAGFNEKGNAKRKGFCQQINAKSQQRS